MIINVVVVVVVGVPEQLSWYSDSATGWTTEETLQKQNIQTYYGDHPAALASVVKTVGA
jgi:hypothetical protein